MLTFSVGMLGMIVSRKVISGVLATKTAYDSKTDFGINIRLFNG